MRNLDDVVVIESFRGRREKPSAPTAIVACAETDRRRFSRLTAPKQGRVSKAYNARFVDVSFGGRTITVAGPVIGSPQAVLVLEKLVALGSRTIVVLGWCGSLQSHVRIGDLLLPNAACSEEGTSAHYPVDSADFLPDRILFSCLREHFEQNALAHHIGPVWTTDAPLRETVTKVRAYGEEGFLAVEMEMSALFRVAAFRDVRLAGLLVVSDELFTLAWKPGFRDNRFKRACAAATRTLLNFCANLPPDLLM
ncbi:MAG: nucleoside phosphorylase [Deltaproteobacteria bacterium]|nr:MAG: nucleoside phosphorylase [Deltaproteobacteria bacterium]